MKVVRRTKEVKHQGVLIVISFQCGQLNFEVTNGTKKGESRDLQEALYSAEIVPMNTIALVRKVQECLGL